MADLEFPQVVHQQVPDGPALDAVTVDHLPGAHLAGDVERPGGGGGVVGEPAQRAHQLVEERAAVSAVAPARLSGFRGGLHHLHAVSDGDVAGLPAFRRHDHGDAGQRDLPGRLARGMLPAQLVQRGEPPGIAGACQRGGQVLRRRGGQQPAHAGPDHVCADQDRQALGAPVLKAADGGVGAAGGGRSGRQDPPVGGLLRAGGHPPLLPGPARHRGQPVQHAADAPAHLGLVVGALEGERGGEHPGQDASPRGPGLLPRRRVDPWRKLPAQPGQVTPVRGPQPGAAGGGWLSLCPRCRGHRGPPGNSTPSDSGRYSGAPPAGSEGAAARRAWWARTLAIVSSTGAEV